MTDPNNQHTKEEKTPEELADYEIYLAEMKNEISHYYVPLPDPEDDEIPY